MTYEERCKLMEYIQEELKKAQEAKNIMWVNSVNRILNFVYEAKEQEK